MDICTPHACLVPTEVKIPRNGLINCCEMPCGFWESNLGPLQDHQVLLTTGPILQSQDTFLKNNISLLSSGLPQPHLLPTHCGLCATPTSSLANTQLQNIQLLKPNTIFLRIISWSFYLLIVLTSSL